MQVPTSAEDVEMIATVSAVDQEIIPPGIFKGAPPPSPLPTNEYVP